MFCNGIDKLRRTDLISHLFCHKFLILHSEANISNISKSSDFPNTDQPTRKLVLHLDRKLL